MKPFRFPLESLRVLRQQKENVAQQQYANALTACGVAETQLLAAVAEQAASWQAFNGDIAHGLPAGKITETRTWWLVLEIRRNERKAALDAAHRAASAAFQLMLAAVRDREAMDRFHDKSQLAHQRAVQREEQKNFDEMAVQASGANSLFQLAGQAN